MAQMTKQMQEIKVFNFSIRILRLVLQCDVNSISYHKVWMAKQKNSIQKLFLSSLVKTFDVHVVTHHDIFKAKITRSFKCRCIFCHKGKAIVIICRKVMILRKQKTHLFHEEQK